MTKGRIIKALSGFYYVKTAEGITECKARGKFRLDGTSPLVGDMVEIEVQKDGKGTVAKIEPRKNWFIRPAVANVDQLVVVASAVIPVTEPFLIDRVAVIAESKDVDVVVCLNKCDENPADDLYEIYRKAGFQVIRTSALTGEGTQSLKELMDGRVSAFTGNSGVGKSSLLNRIDPELHIKTDIVSEKLGRGKHTTRHVELMELEGGALVADTPGFSSFDTDYVDPIMPEDLPKNFREFNNYIGSCRFVNCSHTKEKGCAIVEAVAQGKISKSRHDSYVRLLEQAKQIKPWELDER